MEEFRKWATPREGVLIRDPKSKQLMPSTGFYVPWVGAEGRYWRRRANCGDITISESEEIKKEIKIENKIENKRSK